MRSIIVLEHDVFLSYLSEPVENPKLIFHIRDIEISK